MNVTENSNDNFTIELTGQEEAILENLKATNELTGVQIFRGLLEFHLMRAVRLPSSVVRLAQSAS